MKRRMMLYTLLIVGSLTLSACTLGEVREENETVAEEGASTFISDLADGDEDATSTEAEEDIKPTPEINSEEAVEEQPDEFVPVVERSEEDILAMFDAAVEEEDYGKAGDEAFIWLKTHSSKKVSDKLDELKAMVYGSECICTTYDESDNVIDTSKYTYNEVGDITSEEYNMDNEYHTLYTHHFAYTDGKCTSDICYDENGDIIYEWEAILNDAGNLESEIQTYNNLTTEERTDHFYNDDGMCYKECTTYSGEDGVASKQFTEYTYEGELLVKEVHYDDESEEPFETVLLEYDENNNNTNMEYYDADGEEPYMTLEYEYDVRGNLIKESMVEGVHQEHYEYTYDKFNNRLTSDFYQHDQLKISIVYDYDFLGNVVIETTTEDDVTTTKVYGFKYSLREE